MHPKERRSNKPIPLDPEVLSEGLNDAQLRTLSTLRHFHWTLRFVRRPMFRDPVPVLFDRSNNRYVVIEPDGSVNEHPDITLRDENP
ncbi:hypothetical protein ACFPN1_01615 [Lysobacter yangpyeongensis]|uniref:Uncharacterized protein n=1 Tax=Lysobacter yangpyeongensis TaxID=346182 RepID=A0ABW0SIQ4_9GAMM